MDSIEDSSDEKDVFDRACLFPFMHKKGPEKFKGLHLFKASSSVLLTLAVPEESKSHEEETNLLRHPQALWTVLVINAPSQLASAHNSAEYTTPIAQFIRGVTSSLRTQKTNAQYVCEALRDELKKCDDDSLFDDEHFTKSTMYHLAMKTCEELEASIASNLKFLQRTLDSHITQLCNEAHSYEKVGINYWLQNMKEEIFALEELQAHIHTLRSQIQENVSNPA